MMMSAGTSSVHISLMSEVESDESGGDIMYGVWTPAGANVFRHMCHECSCFLMLSCCLHGASV